MVHYSLTHLLVLTHFCFLHVSLCLSTITISDGTMFFLLTAVCSNIVTESEHLFLWACLILLLSTSCIFSPFIFFTLFSLSLSSFFLNNHHTHTYSPPLSGQRGLTQCCREDRVYVNLVRRLCACSLFRLFICV